MKTRKVNNDRTAAILQLLLVRHSEDVFVSECKNGPSQNSSHLRMDAWAMKRSWANPLTFGYEIKISRADFKADDKWHLYLPYCSEFYFVAAPNVIEPDELPPEAGLIMPSATYAKLFVKKKAQRRQVQIPEELFRYILMCRTRIGPEVESERQSHVEFWKEWLANKKERQQLGWHVSRAVRERVTELKRERDDAIEKSESADKVLEILKNNGLENERLPRTWELKDQLEELKSLFPTDVVEAIDQAARSISRLQEQMKRRIEVVRA